MKKLRNILTSKLSTCRENFYFPVAFLQISEIARKLLTKNVILFLFLQAQKEAAWAVTNLTSGSIETLLKGLYKVNLL